MERILIGRQAEWVSLDRELSRKLKNEKVKEARRLMLLRCQKQGSRPEEVGQGE